MSKLGHAAAVAREAALRARVAELEGEVAEAQAFVDAIMAGAAKGDGDEAHRILPLLWPTISAEYKRRAALKPEETK